MKKQFLETGKIVGTHGVRGEMRIQPWSDTVDFLCTFDTLYLDEKGEKALDIIASRPHGNVVLIKAKGVESISEVDTLRGKILYINRDDVALEEGRHFIDDLIGCSVSDADTAKSLGKLTDVSQTGANDVWHITAQGKEYLVPVIPDVVVSVDVDTGKIVIRPLKGIFDDEN